MAQFVHQRALMHYTMSGNKCVSRSNLSNFSKGEMFVWLPMWSYYQPCIMYNYIVTLLRKKSCDLLPRITETARGISQYNISISHKIKIVWRIMSMTTTEKSWLWMKVWRSKAKSLSVFKEYNVYSTKNVWKGNMTLIIQDHLLIVWSAKCLQINLASRCHRSSPNKNRWSYSCNSLSSTKITINLQFCSH